MRCCKTENHSRSRGQQRAGGAVVAVKVSTYPARVCVPSLLKAMSNTAGTSVTAASTVQQHTMPPCLDGNSLELICTLQEAPMHASWGHLNTHFWINLLAVMAGAAVPCKSRSLVLLAG